MAVQVIHASLSCELLLMWQSQGKRLPVKNILSPLFNSKNLLLQFHMLNDDYSKMEHFSFC